MRFSSLAALLLLACAADPAFEPLVCDPERADHVALGYQAVNEWIEAPIYQLHGRQMLVVDGSCRYFVYDAGLDPDALRTGTLDAEALAALNAELATGPFEAFDGAVVRDGSIDSPWLAVWRDAVGGSCEGPFRQCGSGSAPGALTRTIAAAQRWVARLHAAGEPPTGPVRLFVFSGELAGTVRHAWTGTTDLAALVEGRDTSWGVRLDDAGDAALLRALRAGLGENETLALEQGGTVWTVTVVDETPFDDERGHLRPPIAVP